MGGIPKPGNCSSQREFGAVTERSASSLRPPCVMRPTNEHEYLERLKRARSLVRTESPAARESSRRRRKRWTRRERRERRESARLRAARFPFFPFFPSSSPSRLSAPERSDRFRGTWAADGGAPGEPDAFCFPTPFWQRPRERRTKTKTSPRGGASGYDLLLPPPPRPVRLSTTYTVRTRGSYVSGRSTFIKHTHTHTHTDTQTAGQTQSRPRPGLSSPLCVGAQRRVSSDAGVCVSVTPEQQNVKLIWRFLSTNCKGALCGQTTCYYYCCRG